MFVYDMWGTCFIYCVNFDSFSFFFYVVRMWSLPIQWIRLSGRGKHQRESKTGWKGGDNMGHGIPVGLLEEVMFELRHKYRAISDTWILGKGCSLQREFDKCQGLEAGTSLKKPLMFEEGNWGADNEVKLPRRINGNAKWGSRAGQHETPDLPKTSAWKKVTSVGHFHRAEYSRFENNMCFCF